MRCMPGLTAILLAVTQLAMADLVHRYDFSGSCTDRVGTAHGTLVNGTGLALITNGWLRLGNNGTQLSNSPTNDYVDLPNGLVSALGNRATFEAWVKWNGPAASNWQRIFDFGTSDTGEGGSPGAANQYYIMLTPRANVAGNPFRCGYRKGAPDPVERVLDRLPALPVGAPQHVAVTWDGDRQTASLFLNGVQVTQDTNTHMRLDQIVDNNNWLGRSQFKDAMFAGAYDEFRVYNAPLSPLGVAASRLLGPDTVGGTANVARVERGGLRYIPVHFEAAVAAAKINYNHPVLRAGTQVLGGVPFAIYEDPAGEECWNSYTDGGVGADARTLTIPVNQPGVIEAHVLVSTFWGELATNKLATLIFTAADGAVLRVDLDGGNDIRDYVQGGYANAINGVTTTPVLSSPDNQRIDKLRVILPDDWAARTLASVGLEDRGANNVQRILVGGLTVATAPAADLPANDALVDLDARDLAPTLPNGAPVALWTNAGTLDDFVQTNAVQQPLFNTNVLGVAAVVFDGADDWLASAAAPRGLTGNSDFTIEAWAWNPSLLPEECIYNWARRGGPNGTCAQFNYGSNVLWGACTHWGGVGPDMGFDGGVPAAGAWHHLVLAYEGGNAAEKLYVDGRLNAFAVKTLAIHGTNDGSSISQTLGASTEATGAKSLFFSGALARLRVLDGALTPAQVLENYNADAGLFGRQPLRAPATDPLESALAVWQFGDLNDSRAAPQNSALTLVGELAVGNTANTRPIRARNADGYTAREDGTTNSYAGRALGAVGVEELHLNRSLSLFARVRLEQFNGIDDIARVGNTANASQDYYGLEFDNGRGRFMVQSSGMLAGGVDETAVTHAEPLVAGAWYDLTGVFDAVARTLTLYVYDPGAGAAVGAPATLTVAFNALELAAGMNVLFMEAPNNANGHNQGEQLELAAVWDRALTPAEVARLSDIVPAIGTVLIVR